MTAQILWITGSSITIIMGTIHLFFTFFTDKFSSRNTHVVSEMKTSFPNITRQTTLWKAWVGFNASHSISAIFIGVVNVYLAGWWYSFLLETTFLQLFTLLTVSGYLALAWKYWYSVPLIGILITWLCFLTAILLSL